MSDICTNEEWAAENGESVEWARSMWYCDCPKCVTHLAAIDGPSRGEQIKLTPQAWNGSAEFCREVGMDENHADMLIRAARKMRAHYDGRGTHLRVAYMLESEAREIREGTRDTATHLSLSLARPYLSES